MAELQNDAGSSRRKFLATAGVGAAVVGVAAASPSLASTGSRQVLKDATVVMTVVDAAKGVFAVNVGEREVLITDMAFASKIASAIS